AHAQIVACRNNSQRLGMCGRAAADAPHTAALRSVTGSWSQCVSKKKWRLPMNPKVGRAVLCAPTAATTISCSARDGAHGVTRPTEANQFVATLRADCWR